MIQIVIGEPDAEVIKAELLGRGVEGCAVLFASEHRRADGFVRLLAHRVEFAVAEDYEYRRVREAQLRPHFVAKVTKIARLNDWSLIFAHSHPGSSPPVFSGIDDAGERELSGLLAHRVPNRQHAALVLSEGGFQARPLGDNILAQTIVLGAYRRIVCEPAEMPQADLAAFDRQIRAFGREGQAELSRLRVGIVGLGGTGSIVVQQLVHLGVRDFVLLDPDDVELTNLNRLANAGVTDVGRPKVDVAADYIRRVAPTSRVQAVVGDVIQAQDAGQLLDVDVLFGCTDSHGSRAVLQQISYQYLIPCIDLGSAITVRGGKVTHVFGRVQLLAPGQPCLTCCGLLDAEEVRRDMMSGFERQADPYLRGDREPAPSVMPLNGTVASLATTMLLGVVTAVPTGGRYLLYNAITSAVRTIRGAAQPNCYICSPRGAYAKGDAWPLLARQD